MKAIAILAALTAGAGILGGATLAAAQGAATYGAASAVAPQSGADGSKDFYIATVHLDGRAHISGDANHPVEPYPALALPDGGGIIRREPDAGGYWTMRAFVFQPAQIVVQAGDRLALHFIGVQGPRHRVVVEGVGEPVEVRRGEMQTVRLTAERPGIIRYHSEGRLPSMQGTILVLARP